MEAKVISNGYNKIHIIDKKRSEVEKVVMMKFGDEQSSLFDKFERLSFEVQLNKAMQLDRSRSEPGAMTRARLPLALALPPPAGKSAKNFPAEIPALGPGLTSHVRQGWRRRPSLKSVLKRLLKPIVGVRSGGVKEGVEVVGDSNKDAIFWKSFSRSMRF